MDGLERLALQDWRGQVADLYGHVRRQAATDPPAAWDAWRSAREVLYRAHRMSPVPPARRPDFQARHFSYDPALRFELAVEAEPSEPTGDPNLAGLTLDLPTSGEGGFAVERVGRLEVPLPGGPRRLSLFWVVGYTGGLLLPFRDATSGAETYGAGRYILDTGKGADLGAGSVPSTIVVDFNFAYQPSCAFDARWRCPLPPPENWLNVAIQAGERLV